MKSLLIIRHAKSSWDLSILHDFDRTLNERGNRDAPEMARRLIKENVNIDAFISSPAKRAKKTARLFIQEYQRNKEEIIYIPELYNVTMSVLLRLVAGLNNEYQSVAIFSHNPGVTEFVNDLTSFKIDDMPTCGVFGVKISTDKWENFERSEKEFWFFDYPKLKT